VCTTMMSSSPLNRDIQRAERVAASPRTDASANQGLHRAVRVVEKFCLTEEDLEEIVATHQAGVSLQLMVGFNRRFAPLATALKARPGAGPMAMVYRINAGRILPDSWIQDPAMGGGRIIGEACHFIDFLTFLCGSLPTLVHAVAVPDPNGFCDTVSINLGFVNGSIGTVCYYANGAKSLAKEYVEVYQSGQTGILRDFKHLEIHGSRKLFRKKTVNQDKGQARMVQAFLERIKSGGPALTSPEELARVAQVTFAVHESLRTRQAFGV